MKQIFDQTQLYYHSSKRMFALVLGDYSHSELVIKFCLSEYLRDMYTGYNNWLIIKSSTFFSDFKKVRENNFNSLFSKDHIGFRSHLNIDPQLILNYRRNHHLSTYGLNREDYSLDPGSEKIPDFINNLLVKGEDNFKGSQIGYTNQKKQEIYINSADAIKDIQDSLVSKFLVDNINNIPTLDQLEDLVAELKAVKVFKVSISE